MYCKREENHLSVENARLEAELLPCDLQRKPLNFEYDSVVRYTQTPLHMLMCLVQENFPMFSDSIETLEKTASYMSMSDVISTKLESYRSDCGVLNRELGHDIGLRGCVMFNKGNESSRSWRQLNKSTFLASRRLLDELKTAINDVPIDFANVLNRNQLRMETIPYFIAHQLYKDNAKRLEMANEMRRYISLYGRWNHLDRSSSSSSASFNQQLNDGDEDFDDDEGSEQVIKHLSNDLMKQLNLLTNKNRNMPGVNPSEMDSSDLEEDIVDC